MDPFLFTFYWTSWQNSAVEILLETLSLWFCFDLSDFCILVFFACSIKTLNVGLPQGLGSRFSSNPIHFSQVILPVFMAKLSPLLQSL